MRQTQKKLAAKVMKCGKDRVWIDPTDEKVSKAITRSDIRRFIKEGAIRKLPVKKNLVKEHGKQRSGSRKGTYSARIGGKTVWLRTIRPQRKMLKEMREDNLMDKKNYRKMYGLIKGGKFRTKKHMLIYLKEEGIISKGEKK